MFRLGMFLLAIGFTGGVANAACNRVPVPETPKSLISAFSQRMGKLGVGDWHLATQTARGPMYISLKSDLTFVVRDEGGLVGEVFVLLSDPSPADNARLEVATAFLAARIGGAPEALLQQRIVRAITETRKSRQDQAISEGETTLVISSPAPEAVAVALGRLRFD